MRTGDRPMGQILSRRKALALFRSAGTALLVVACTTKQSGSSTSAVAQTPTSSPAATPTNLATSPTCIVSPEQTEGPYFVDEKLNRSDIRSDPSDDSVREGVPLSLKLRISQIARTGCTPLSGAIVDIWHCDARGIYSDVSDPGFNTVGKKFLRGYQVTDANGTVYFTTIYPGWYQGRTVHIHLKVRTPAAAQPSYEFTSQLYFDDSVTDQVHTQVPYASKGERTIKNTDDRIFSRGGNKMVLALTKNAYGYSGVLEIGMQMTGSAK